LNASYLEMPVTQEAFLIYSSSTPTLVQNTLPLSIPERQVREERVSVRKDLLTSFPPQEPLQFFWFRASIRLFNSMLDSNNETLRRVLKADLHLASFDSSCWSAQVSNACNGLQSSAMFNQKMLRAWFPCKSSFAICVSDI